MKEFTVIWRIQNYSYCWHKNGEMLESPAFLADVMQSTAWNLVFYPKGFSGGSMFTYFPARSDASGEPEALALNCELSLLTADGLLLHSSVIEHEFTTYSTQAVNSYYSVQQLAEKKFGLKQLPLDVLVVRCRMWTGTGNVCESGQSSACTHINVERISVVQVVQGFSGFEPSATKDFQVKSGSGGRPLMSIKLSVNEGLSCKGKVMVKMTNAVKHIKIITCKIYLLDAAGNRIECGPADARFDLRGKDATMLLSLTKQQLLDRKDEYLPNDVLTLQYECAFSTRLQVKKVERTDYGLHLMPPGTPIVHRDNAGTAVVKLSDSPTALDDLRSLYNEQAFSDVVIKTETETFPAHKTVLAARSAVFKTMLTSDMKVKTNLCIEVEGLEDDILRQLLLFLYTDDLEDLQWDTAIKLYYAADKYEVHLLKVQCSLFLTDNISASNAVELLLLADLHKDSRLKTVCENFIVEHEKEIFNSVAWAAVKESNPHLALRTMHLKYRKV